MARLMVTVVPHRILDNEHPRLFQVFAQTLDVKADSRLRMSTVVR